jgi:hypothetical protein
MKDKRGLFYYPFPLNRRVHMYVREEGGQILFRMWNAEDPALWEEHGWLPYGAIRRAADLYQGKPKTFDPKQAYDLNLARALLKDGG